MLENFAYIGTSIAGITGLITAIVSLVKSSNTKTQLKDVKVSLNHSNLKLIFDIELDFNARRGQLISLRQKKAEAEAMFEGKTEGLKKYVETLESHIKEAYESYLNLFDRIAYFILNNKLDEGDFITEYRDSLFETVENNLYDKFNNSSNYRNMMKLYNRWKDK
jgi:hypothetical protein